jgi:hypothetical protein
LAGLSQSHVLQAIHTPQEIEGKFLPGFIPQMLFAQLFLAILLHPVLIEALAEKMLASSYPKQHSVFE